MSMTGMRYAFVKSVSAACIKPIRSNPDTLQKVLLISELFAAIFVNSQHSFIDRPDLASFYGVGLLAQPCNDLSNSVDASRLGGSFNF